MKMELLKVHLRVHQKRVYSFNKQLKMVTRTLYNQSRIKRKTVIFRVF